MKIRNSLKSLKKRPRDNRVIRRRGRTYVINKTNKRITPSRWRSAWYLSASCSML